MIVVRDIFRLKFGQSKEVTTLWKVAIESLRRNGFNAGPVRLLTDLAGPSYYTLILESTFESVGQWEKASQTARANPEWKAAYAKIITLTETGHREILTVVE
jgi:hypothetical protein